MVLDILIKNGRLGLDKFRIDLDGDGENNIWEFT
jgi:hypothetical protein